MQRGRLRRVGGAICSIATVALVAGGPAAQAFNPAVEAQNYSKGSERRAIYDTPQYQALLTQISIQNRRAAAAAQAADPERNFSGHLCTGYDNGCAGDVRLYDWEAKGYGIVRPVLFTSRSGATISGHVWATRAGPAKRPGIVITNGSVQAPETVYWFVAQTLAKDGYVVLTWDPQGQGQSDEQGASPDQSEGSPAQSDGRPFFDGTEDALNFFFSSPSRPYEPVPSCNSGTSHADKQNRRVKEGFDQAYNPFWGMLDPSRVGIAGHSYGAAGVSYIGQWDPRVKSTVAFDNLAAPDPNQPFGGSGGGPEEKGCVNAADRAPAPVTKPALGMSADYFIPPVPNTGDPDPLAKSQESLAYTKTGVDTGEIIIRGGTHYDFDWVPNDGFPATLRGADEIAWYTTAWFDKYVKGDPSADARLLTGGWRNDPQEGAVDPNHDPNVFSFYYRSRLDVGLSGGGRFDCEDMRSGCPGMTNADTANYSYLKIDTSPDVGGAGSAGGIYGCGKKPNTVVPLSRHHARIVRASVYFGKRRVTVVRGHSLRRVTIPAPGPGRHSVRIVLVTSKHKRLVSVRTYNGCKKTKPKRISRSHRRHSHRR